LLLVSLTDLAVLAALATRRIPLIFAGSEWTGETFPLLQFYLIPVEKGLLTFSAFIFLIFMLRTCGGASIIETRDSLEGGSIMER